MRKLKCYDIHGVTVQEVLDEFNERRGEFSVADADIISISVRNAANAVNVASGARSTRPAVVVTIFY